MRQTLPVTARAKLPGVAALGQKGDKQVGMYWPVHVANGILKGVIWPTGS